MNFRAKRFVVYGMITAAVLLSACSPKTAENPGAEAVEIAVADAAATFSAEAAGTAEPETYGSGGLDLPTAGSDITNYPELFYSVYRVQKGDMIGSIAERFGVTQDSIISVNNIRQSRLIQIGQYLRIPTIPGILYTTREQQETPETIAQKYGVSPEKVATVNRLQAAETLEKGATVFVPDALLDWVSRQEINGDLFIRPLRRSFAFSSYYGWRNNPFSGSRTFHNGVDMVVPFGSPVYAALEGRVIFAGWDNTFGNCIIIAHHSGYQTLYGHLSKITTSKGRSVTTTTKIGEVGNTGLSTGAHLHFTVSKNGRTMNPQALWL